MALLIAIDSEIPAKAVKQQPPCCGLCTLSAQTIQLYFWPSGTVTATPTVTNLPANVTVVPSGFTVEDGNGTTVDDAGFTL